MNLNDMELEEHHRVIRALDGKLDKLMRERQYGSLEDAYWIISQRATQARRRLRKLANER